MQLVAWTLAFLAAALGPAMAQDDTASNRRPVRVVADQRLVVTTPAGHGALPLYVSADWTQPQPSITRAVIVLHGVLRNADVYLRSGQLAQRNAGAAAEGTLLVVPQFLAGIDIPAHGLPPETLRWGLISWQGGEDAEGPAPISSFDALDAIVARLADARLFPALRAIVVAGHSGGGQVAQRYATIGQAETALGASRGRVALRYVVANPSSYAWPGPERPDGQVGFALPAGCPGYDAWKYGYAGLPRYAGGVAAAGLEEAYLARDVVYLVGQADVDPMHSALDRTCPAALQGPHRLGRGRAFFAYLLARHPDGVAHRLLEVPGVGHDSAGMFGSACGRSALFDAPGC